MEIDFNLDNYDLPDLLNLFNLNHNFNNPLLKFEKFDINFSDENAKNSSLSPMPAPDFMALGLESDVGKILVDRWEEAQRCVDSKAHLSAIIIMGSMLEGLLLGVLQRNPSKANQCTTAPKDSKSGKIKKFRTLEAS